MCWHQVVRHWAVPEAQRLQNQRAALWQRGHCRPGGTGREPGRCGSAEAGSVSCCKQNSCQKKLILMLFCSYCFVLITQLHNYCVGFVWGLFFPPCQFVSSALPVCSWGWFSRSDTCCGFLFSHGLAALSPHHRVEVFYKCREDNQLKMHMQHVK